MLAYARAQSLDLMDEFTEIETGTRKRARPELVTRLLGSGRVLLVKTWKAEKGKRKNLPPKKDRLIPDP